MNSSEPALPRLIAFYLPQYYPTPENSAWWEPGFTEWHNVTRARPLFRGHEQPHLPADLGFYDLRVPESRAAQAELARRYGIGAFCYYHYWFHGRRLLERPFAEVLASGEPDFPFCLSWANGSWTRRWNGDERNTLLAQEYSLKDDETHFHALLPAFRDPRYLRHDGCPLFLIHNPTRLPDPRATCVLWQKLARENGLPGLHLLAVESVREQHRDPRADGFDAAVQFQPDILAQAGRPWHRRRVRLGKLLRLRSAFMNHLIVPYSKLVERALSQPAPAYPRYPGITPRWDNTARVKNGGVILRDSTPGLFERWLRRILTDQRPPYVFINAWNEWAEGCHLEPCQQHGHAYLEAILRATQAPSPQSD